MTTIDAGHTETDSISVEYDEPQIVIKYAPPARKSRKIHGLFYLLPALLIQAGYLLPAVRSGWTPSDRLVYPHNAFLNLMDPGAWTAYKAAIIGITVLISAAMWLACRRAGLSRGAASIALLAATACIQFRNFGHSAFQDFGTAYTQELSRVLPGGYQWDAHYRQFQGISDFLNTAAIAALALGFVSFLAVIIYGWRSRRNPISTRATVRNVLIGAVMIVVPAIPIAAVRTFQGDLQFGPAYLPVLIQVFGAGFIAASIFQRLLNTRVGLFPVISAEIVFIVAALVATSLAYDSAMNNTTAKLLSAYKLMQSEQVLSLKDGAMDNVPTGSTVYTDYPWETTAFFDKYAGKHYYVHSITDPSFARQDKASGACALQSQAVYEFHNDMPSSSHATPLEILCVGPIG